MARIAAIFGALLLALATPVWAAGEEPIAIDTFDDVSAWSVIASDGVELKLSKDAGLPKKTDDDPATALRMDFDFKKGSGYCIARRAVDIDLPENYAFSFYVKGDCPANNLEFKLYDETGDNVWWVNQRAFEFDKTEFKKQRFKQRQIEFAWGPGGAQKPLRKVKFIEIGIAASSGGKGSIWIDSLRMSPLPAVSAPKQVLLSASSGEVPAVLPESGEINWASSKTDRHASITLDFQVAREIGGIAIDWGIDAEAPCYEVRPVEESEQHRTNQENSGGVSPGKTTYHQFPGAEVKRLTISAGCENVLNGGEYPPIAIRRIRVLPLSFGSSLNEKYKVIAAESRRGMYPRYFLGAQTNWTIVGADGGGHEALLSELGAIELGKLGVSVEPFIHMKGDVLTWADAVCEPSLIDDRLPIPRLTMRFPENKVNLEVTPFVEQLKTHSELSVRYIVTGEYPKCDVELLLAVRPFQVLPPWQNINITGGITPSIRKMIVGAKPIAGVQFTGAGDLYSHTEPYGAYFPLSPPEQELLFLSTGYFGASSEGTGTPSGGWKYLYCPDAPSTQSAWIGYGFESGARVDKASSVELEGRLEQVVQDWRAKLNRIKLSLPEVGNAKHLTDSFYANIGYILINRDGPGLQPGSRTYDRTWIRDGALEATALLYTGHADVVREFLDWFKGFQYEDGKVPCCVDQRGPDPVPENDSHGQYIYAVATYHRFTHDTELLKRHLPNIKGAIAYIEKLRDTRRTDPFKNGPPEERAKYGLMPESISHEGYSAKPMHSYWDDFFTLRGLKDAVYIAEQLHDAPLAKQWGVLRDDFKKCLYDSIALSQQNKSITFVPGCVELGDFDATSTAAAIFPGGELGGPADVSLEATFDRYFNWFCDRRDGKIEWDAYTPYEIRNASALLMLGHPEKAHQVLDWMLKGQSVEGWREWPEIVYKDRKTGKFIGDMPHTWVGSDYVKAVRNLCVYEREHDQALILGAGLKREWVETGDGVTVANFPTEYGPVSYTLKGSAGKWHLEVRSGVTPPPGGIWFQPMGGKPVRIEKLPASLDCDVTR